MVAVKTCNKCNLELSHDKFHKGNGKFNLKSRCKECCKSYKKHSKEYKKKYYRANREVHIQKTREYQVKNIEKIKEYQKRWALENRGLRNAAEAKRRAIKLKATLPGYDAELKEIYKKCPKGYHVDHIMPLQGSNLCGLHVPWNLQYLPAVENLKKSNKVV